MKHTIWNIVMVILILGSIPTVILLGLPPGIIFAFVMVILGIDGLIVIRMMSKIEKKTWNDR